MVVHAGIVAKVVFPDETGIGGSGWMGICEFAINNVMVKFGNVWEGTSVKEMSR